MTRRQEKVNDQIQTEVADLISRRIKHPGLEGVLCSITHVDVSPDLMIAHVYISLLDDTVDERVVIDALEHSETFMHHELVQRLHMRRIPHLRFHVDHSIAEADRLTRLMREVANSEGRELPR